MPPAARKTATRKATPRAATPKPAVEASPSPLEPSITSLVLTSDETPEDVDLVELCSIDGKPMMIPARPHVGLALQVLEDMEQYNEGIATMRLLRTLLGEEQYRQLSQFKGLKASHLRQLADGVTKLTLGAMDEDDPSGN